MSWTVTNQFGTVSATPQGGSLGSSVAARNTIANHEVKEFTVEVPAGATRLTATIGKTSDPGADLDLFVLRGGSIVAQQADGDSEESVTIANPAAGTYTVRGTGTPSPPARRSTTTSTCSSARARLADGPWDRRRPRSWRLGAGQRRDHGERGLAAGRRLFGEMRVVSTEGAVLGTGSVVVGSVATP